MSLQTVETPTMPNADILYAGSDPFNENEDLGAYDPDMQPQPSTLPEPEPQAAAEPEPTPEPAAEPAPEPQPEPQAAAEPEPQPEPEPQRKPSIKIPKERLDKEVQRRRAAEEQLRALQARLASMDAKTTAPEVAVDFGETVKEMFDKVLDGNVSRATELFNTMIKDTVSSTVTAVTKDIDSRIEGTFRAATAKTAEDQVIDDLESRFEFFNPQSEAYNDDLVQETLAIRRGFVERGLAPAEAMRRAADYVVRFHHPDALAPEPEPEPAAPVAPAAPAKPTAARQASVQAAAAAAAAQPPRIVGQSQAAPPAIDLNNLSDDEYAALPESALRRLRGDYL